MNSGDLVREETPVEAGATLLGSSLGVINRLHTPADSCTPWFTSMLHQAKARHWRIFIIHLVLCVHLNLWGARCLAAPPPSDAASLIAALTLFFHPSTSARLKQTLWCWDCLFVLCCFATCYFLSPPCWDRLDNRIRKNCLWFPSWWGVMAGVRKGVGCEGRKGEGAGCALFQADCTLIVPRLPVVTSLWLPVTWWWLCWPLWLMQRFGWGGWRH